MSETHIALDVPPVLTGSPIPVSVNLRLTDLEAQVGVTGSTDPLSVENRLTVAQEDIVTAQEDIVTAQDTIDAHIADVANPHNVTKTQLALGNVDNTSDIDKPVSTAQAAADAAVLAAAEPVGSSTAAVSAHAAGTGVHVIASTTGLQAALDSKSGTAHNHTGVYDLEGAAAAAQAAAIASAAADATSKANAAQAAATDASTPIAHASNTSNPHSVTAAQVGADATGTAASAVSAHAGQTTTHGISAFGATLVDDTSASAARSTLGLGGVATLSVGTTAGTVAAGDDSRLITGLTGLTSGGVLFANSSTTTGQDGSKLFWDNTNKRLGVGSNAPRALLEIYGDSIANVGSFLLDQPTAPTGNTNFGPHFFMKSGGVSRGWVGFFDSSSHGQGTKLNIKSDGDVGFRGGAIGGVDQVTLTGTTGNLGIGTLTPSERLDVAGNISSFGGDFVLKRTTSTTDNVLAASIISAWTVNTHASRQGEVSIGASDYNGRKEAIKVGANGAAATFSAFGVPLTTRPAALTTQLTTISYVEPGTPDYALQAVVGGGYGFATADEGLTLFKVIANLQVRLGQAEAALKSLGWLS